MPLRLAADVVVVGGGLAGLSAALQLAPLRVALLAAAPLGADAASAWAQGGLAAAMAADDSPALHAEDTLRVGGGIVDAEVARLVAAAAPAAALALERHGVRFDRNDTGAPLLGLEAGHSRRRILHSGGDGTGRAAMGGLAAAARAADWISLFEGAAAHDLLLADGAAAGIVGAWRGRPLVVAASAVILATGGIGRLYGRTTNPAGACGTGLAMAARAGARLADLEFVQFHPTALDVGLDPMPLATEALRGEGAVLVDERGRRFMVGLHPAGELAPRDVVARAVWQQRRDGRKTFLDCRAALGAGFAARFPTVWEHCRQAGLDPAATPIPVAPAAHYHMGGIAVDRAGRSSLDRLWACGEVACTGLHGANRLASNSLVEALVFARIIAEDIRGRVPPPAVVSDAISPGAARAEAGAADELPPILRRLMDDCVGVVREQAGLARAIAALDDLAARPEFGRLARDGLSVARLVAAAALARRESRGSHHRSDFPQTGTDSGRRSVPSPVKTEGQRLPMTRNSEASPCSVAS